MGKQGYHMNQMKSFSKETSNDHMKGRTNGLDVKERDYMIHKVITRFGIIDKFQPAVAKAANYIDGARFWELYECAEKAHSPARYFIKAINRELYSNR